MHSIIVSRKDSAGLNIKQRLVENFGFKETEGEFDGNHIFQLKNFELITINECQLYADYVDELDSDLLIFASKHASKNGPADFTVHAPGNWGKAERGGKERTLVPTYANLLKNYLVGLQSARDEVKLDYAVTLECTHHGAFLTRPSVYIEIGSTDSQWGDARAGEVVAGVIMNSTNIGGGNRVAVAFGGSHYPSEFTKLVLRKDYALSHICPKYALPCFDAEMLQKAVEATKEKVDEIVLDEKGLGTEKERLKALLGQQELPVGRVRKLLEK